MARLTQAPMTPRRSVSNPDSLTDLNRLLARLQQSILHADAERERRLRTSEYERNKAEINLEYARTLLTKLEQDALGVKVHSRRQEMQTDLNRKREVFEQITERLRELEDLSIDSDEDSDEGEDLLADIIQTPSESMDSRSPERRGMDLQDVEEEGEVSYEEDESTVPPGTQDSGSAAAAESRSPVTTREGAPKTPGTTTTQTVRSRGPAIQPATDTAETSARAQLFGNRDSTTTTSLSTTATTEAVLDHQRAEQDKLTESLLNMAKSLKSTSQAFQTDLEQEKDILGGAGTSMEKSELSMEQASRRMGTLRKMSEGKGLWGRMMLYLWIAGLMMVAVLIVFVMPKLRF
ncbi:synaptobrevin [Xylariales sp. AK1849]|nr:synaptobrevin [Xylariales sp. AK1849]